MAESDYLKRVDAAGHLKVLEALRRWDPIGVFCNGQGPKDEYDSYAPGIIRMLDQGVAATELARVLHNIAHECMCIDSDAERNAAIAHELVEFWGNWRRGAS